MLKSCRQLSMTVRSPGGGWAPRQTCSWMDRQGRPVSPPLEYQRPPPALPPAPATTRYPPYGSRSTSKDRSIRRVISFYFFKNRLFDYTSLHFCIFICKYIALIEYYMRLFGVLGGSLYRTRTIFRFND